MAHVVIVGGGFAGVRSAAGAALTRGDADLRITPIGPNEPLVLRPCPYEPEPDSAKVELRRIMEPIGAGHLRVVVVGAGFVGLKAATATATALAAGPGAGSCWWTAPKWSQTSLTRDHAGRSRRHWGSWAWNAASGQR
ncbi:hypothetical protein AB0N81_11925 [Streptomyces sp. NPDC093510]|uniref:hypothetical protein n=1 Tax=Streptomyces sp. NPDC093510 TaxID=3155199 RepID=UPI003436B470